MAELERAARFSLRSVAFARMFLVGLVDTAGLLIVTAAVRSYLACSLLRVFLYMMVPYLTASYIGSVYERKKRTNAVYGSLTICLLSSVLFAAMPFFFRQIYDRGMTVVWAAAFVLLTCGFIVNMRKYIHEMEDPAWN